MRRRMIIFLVRRRLGLKKREKFRFTNQNSNAFYYFTSTDIMKADWSGTRPSSVSLHWLLDDKCAIEKIEN